MTLSKNAETEKINQWCAHNGYPPPQTPEYLAEIKRKMGNKSFQSSFGGGDFSELNIKKVPKKKKSKRSLLR
jgi:hypothetical protein